MNKMLGKFILFVAVLIVWVAETVNFALFVIPSNRDVFGYISISVALITTQFSVIWKIK